MLRNNSVFCWMWKYLDERYLYSSGGVILPDMCLRKKQKFWILEREETIEYSNNRIERQTLRYVYVSKTRARKMFYRTEKLINIRIYFCCIIIINYIITCIT